jgi:glutaredoxin-related protein
MRKTLQNTETQAQTRIEDFHATVVAEVENEIQRHEWVVVGMAGNPFVRKARKLLEQKGIEFRYIEYGTYLSKWKERLAIKLWSGWPTFPQVFHKGKLVGGFSELERSLKY